jgi:acetyltransferase AlgX (SGNH hydrolase-like protein)/Fascin domain-containing protein
MQNKFKLILFLLLFALLWLPFFQQLTRLFKEPELKGAFVKPSMPVFSMDSLNALKFQKHFEDFENYNFGFRGLFVKIRNSVDNILFNDLSVVDNIAGKDGFIFSVGSIERALGIQYDGKAKNEAVIEKIKFLKEGIEKNGGHFLAVIAPSKEIVFPDFLPPKYIGKYKTPNYYTDFIEGYKKANIPFIDFCPYFKNLRKTSPYPLFTKAGFHWSIYGASFAQDSLISYVEKNLSKSLPKYKRIGVELSDTARESDADFEYSLNLFYSVGQSQYVYPKLEMIPLTKKNYRPKVIIIGDSYFQQIKNQKMLKDVFSEDSRFWFYFATTTYPLSDAAATPLLKDADVMDELRSADYVILFCNVSTLHFFPYGVDDFYYDHLSKPGVVEYVSESIKNNPKWIETIQTKEINKNIPINELIIQEAKHIFSRRKVFNLKAGNDKYTMADGNNNEIILANSDNTWQWETFSILYIENDKIAIYSHKGKFLSAELGNKAEITATRDRIGAWETFTLIKLDNNSVAFKADNGKYLSLDEKTKQIFAAADKIGKNEKFKLINAK